MKLQTKLIISFSVLLLLVAGTAASGWFAMNEMNRVTRQLAAVDNAMFALQDSQIFNLRYQMYKDKSYAPQSAEAIQKSIKYLNNAVTYTKMPQQQQRVKAAIDGAQKFAAALAILAENTEKCLVIVDNMTKLSIDISNESGKTLEILNASLKNEFNDHRFDAFSLMNIVDSNIYLARLKATQFIADPVPAKAKEVEKVLDEAQKQAVDAEKMLVYQQNKDAVNRVIKDIMDYRKLFLQYVAISISTDKTLRDVREQGVMVTSICLEISDSAEEIIATTQANSNATSMAVLVAAILIGIGITIGLTRNITRQLGKDPGELATIATRVTNGDYNIDDGSARMGVYDNIVGMVAALKEHIENAQQATDQARQESARATEAMKAADAASKDAQAKRDSILVAADRLEEVASVVSSAAEELSAQIEQSERGAAEQASRVSETATAMEEMNSTVLEVARNAANANNGGKAMREKAVEGAAVVDSSVAGVQKARTDALALKDDMNTLSEQAQSIGQIMNVISDIADQTNLLALNAAIEAARAGEAGRGFAVVADEVRKLAEKTMQSTTDVGNAIKTIQDSAAKNMAQVDATVKNIEISTEYAEKSGHSLREIVEMVDSAVAQVGSIATASEQQSATSEEINRSISHVSTIATETARAMQEAAQAVSDLSHQAQILTRLIEDMKKS